MSAAAIAALLQVVLTELPGAITTVQALMNLGQKFFASLNGRDPTADEIGQIESAIDADVMEALEPLPAPQPGDPDYKA